PDEIKNDPAFYPTDDIIKKLEVYDNLGSRWLGIYNDLYLQFKMYRK
ncbi:TPA: spermidine/putrescine ABC transporter substrate-binding protein, partial [Streptococcus pyogenes]